MHVIDQGTVDDARDRIPVGFSLLIFAVKPLSRKMAV